MKRKHAPAAVAPNGEPAPAEVELPVVTIVAVMCHLGCGVGFLVGQARLHCQRGREGGKVTETKTYGLVGDNLFVWRCCC